MWLKGEKNGKIQESFAFSDNEDLYCLNYSHLFCALYTFKFKVQLCQRLKFVGCVKNEKSSSCKVQTFTCLNSFYCRSLIWLLIKSFCGRE